jgi:hypothetical protein
MEVCPGEAKCSIWEATAGKTHEERERKACRPNPERKLPGCPMFSTKTDEGKRTHKSCVELVERGMHIRRQKHAGYLPPKTRIGHLEFETYLKIDELIEHEETSLVRRIPELLMAGFQLKPKT